MKKTLKKAVQEQMKSMSLDDQQLDKLMQIQQDQADQSNDVPLNTVVKAQSTTMRWAVMASVMVLVLVMSIVFVTQRTAPPTHEQISAHLIQQIANEVAGNHLKMKPMEVQTAAINDIQHYFTELDFMPQQSQHSSAVSGITLAGGRYCSIQGSTAAQLRYKNPSGGYVTLFETHYDPTLFQQLPDVDNGGMPIVTFARGIKVTIWVEHGLLMVSTEKPE